MLSCGSKIEECRCYRQDSATVLYRDEREEELAQHDIDLTPARSTAMVLPVEIVSQSHVSIVCGYLLYRAGVGKG